MLTQIKLGVLDEEMANCLWSLRRPLEVIEGIKPTRLYTHRANVQTENQVEFGKIQKPEFVFEAMDTGKIIISKNKTRWMGESELEIPFFTNLQSSKTLKLKEESQVMLLKNINPTSGLVNGSRGIIENFEEYTLEGLLGIAADGDRAMFERYHAENHDTKTGMVNLPCVRFIGHDADIPMGARTVLPASWTHESTLPDGSTQKLERVQLPLALACKPTHPTCPFSPSLSTPLIP